MRGLLHLNWLVLVGEYGVASDNVEAGDFRQVRNDVLRNAIGKILLFWITAHVEKGQHSYGRLVCCCFRANRYARHSRYPIDAHSFGNILQGLRTKILE